MSGVYEENFYESQLQRRGQFQHNGHHNNLRESSDEYQDDSTLYHHKKLSHNGSSFAGVRMDDKTSSQGRNSLSY